MEGEGRAGRRKVQTPPPSIPAYAPEVTSRPNVLISKNTKNEFVTFRPLSDLKPSSEEAGSLLL